MTSYPHRRLYWVLLLAGLLLFPSGQALCATDPPKAALNHYAAAKKAARAMPKKAEAWIELGLAAKELGRLKEAQAALRKAVLLDPASLRARLEYMQLLAAVGDAKGAARQAEQLRARAGLGAADGELAATLAAMAGDGDARGLSELSARRAAELIGAGRPEEADKLLAALGNAGDPAVLYLRGLSAARKGEAKAAAEFFRKVLEQEPGNERVRLELAAALYADRQYADAQAELLRLKERTLPDEVGQTLDRFLEVTRAAQAKPWRVRGQVSWLFDSNASQGPAATGVSTSIGRVGLPRLSQARADTGLVHNLDGDATWLLSDHFGWQLQGSAKAVTYFNLYQYDTLQLSAATGPTFTTGRFAVSLPATFTYLKYDFSRAGYYYMATGVAPQMRYRLSDNLYLNLNLAYQHKFYDPSYDRYGNVLSASPSLRYFIDDRSFLEAGGAYVFEKQNLDINSYHSYGGFASYFRTILPNLTGAASLQLNWLDYLKEREIFQKTQHDFNLNARLSLAYTIEALWKLTPELSYTFTHNQSTIPLYSYDRHQVMAGVSRTF